MHTEITQKSAAQSCYSINCIEKGLTPSLPALHYVRLTLPPFFACQKSNLAWSAHGSDRQ